MRRRRVSLTRHTRDENLRAMRAWETDVAERTYQNDGNPDVVALVPNDAANVLDVGCGAGGVARLLRARNPCTLVTGITASEAEARAAAPHLAAALVLDLEAPLPQQLLEQRFDVIIFSHVLEHLRRPEQVVARFAELLTPGGVVVIAVPNVAGWRDRVQLTMGRFEYREGGTFDSTHLRFFTFYTAARYLLAAAPQLRVDLQRVTGSVPLWPLRRLKVAAPLCRAVDQLGCALRPNLFGGQVLIRATRSA